jgi:hypothetical protein
MIGRGIYLSCPKAARAVDMRLEAQCGGLAERGEGKRMELCRSPAKGSDRIPCPQRVLTPTLGDGQGRQLSRCSASSGAGGAGILLRQRAAPNTIGKSLDFKHLSQSIAKNSP